MYKGQQEISLPLVSVSSQALLTLVQTSPAGVHVQPLQLQYNPIHPLSIGPNQQRIDEAGAARRDSDAAAAGRAEAPAYLPGGQRRTDGVIMRL